MRKSNKLLSIFAILIAIFMLASCSFFDETTELRFISFPKNTYELTDWDNLEEIKESIIVGVTRGDKEEEYTLNELDDKNAKITGLDFSYTGKHTLTVKFGSTVISYDYRVVGAENVEGVEGVSYLNGVFYVGGTDNALYNVHSFQNLVNHIEENEEFYNKEYTIQLGSGLYDGHILLKQFPTFDGSTGISRAAAETTAHVVSLNILGAANFKSEFNGTIEIVGYGSNNSGYPNISPERTHIYIDGILFKTEELTTQEPLRVFQHCVNVSVTNCKFVNCGRMITGYAQHGGNGCYADSNYSTSGYCFNLSISDCDFENTDGCIQGYVNAAEGIVNEIKNITANTTRGGFLNSQSNGSFKISGCEVTCAGYGIRTQSSTSVTINIENSTFNVKAESGKYAITLRNAFTSLILKNVSFGENASIGCSAANETTKVSLLGSTPYIGDITWTNISETQVKDHE